MTPSTGRSTPRLAGLDKVRDSLALRVKGELEAAAFGDQPIVGAAGQTAACKGIIAAAGVLAKHLSATTRSRRRPDACVRAAACPSGRMSDNGPVESQPREVVILGSTGSIGTQALDIVRRNPGRFRVVALAAGGGQPDLLARQAAEFGLAAVAVASPAAAAEVRDFISRTGRALASPPPQVLSGPDAVSELAAWPCDVVLNGVTGAAGLAATLAALDAGRVLALANKESLIVGGPLVTSRAKPGQIVPVDSEHSTIAQCLRAGRESEVLRLVLTASGGPFRGWSRDKLEDVTPEQALAHPTWNMGPLVTINSATLVNKGLEVIEAHLLFGFGLDRIDVVVHPAVDRALDGGVLRRRDDHPGVPAGHAAADLARPGLARPGAGGRAGPGLVHGGELDLRAARRRGLPRGRAGPGGRRGRRHRARGVQRGERGVRGGLPGGKDRLSPDC